jgi:hypothetical protein
LIKGRLDEVVLERDIGKALHMLDIHFEVFVLWLQGWCAEVLQNCHLGVAGKQ